MPEMNADLYASLEEAAAALVLAANIAGATAANVFTGQDTADKVAPCVICESAGEGREEPLDTGNFETELTVWVKSPGAIDTNAVDPKPAHDALVKAVFAVFKSVTLAGDLSGAGVPNFTVIAARVVGPGFEPAGDELVNYLKVWIYACASTLTP